MRGLSLRAVNRKRRILKGRKTQIGAVLHSECFELVALHRDFPRDEMTGRNESRAEQALLQ